MRHDKLKQELSLLLLLLQNKKRSVAELCKLTGLSRRNMYYYLDTFDLSGEFELVRTNYGFSISPNSKFITKMLAALGINKSYNLEVRRMLNSAVERSIASDKKEVLRQAIEEKRMIKIVGYSSSNSRSVKDRVVEPFKILDNGIEVRCYEVSSKMCKTFRISRMKEVKLLDTSWFCEDKHVMIYTDIFSYSSEDLTHVKLRMGRVAYNSLIESYPGAKLYIAEHKDDDGSSYWILETDVCSLEGVARFILTNIDDVVIQCGDGLTEYIRSKIMVFINTHDIQP